MSRGLLAIRHIEPAELRALIDRAAEFKVKVETEQEISLSKKKTVGLLFFENSTRTRVSFEQAANYLGCRVVNFSGSGSSLSKGETLKDTLLTLRQERLDCVVMRHSASGATQLAAQFFGGPVINAGDGEHEHPTQALADALTIMQRKGRIEGLKVAIVGDVLHSRVARSNAWLLSKLGAEVRFVGPRTLMPGTTARLPAQVYYDLRKGIAGADVVMCLRLQKERMADGLVSSIREYASLYQVNRSTLKAAHPEAIVMHPGPVNRGIEVDDATADGAASSILDQVMNGIYVRMAAIEWVFEDMEAKLA